MTRKATTFAAAAAVLALAVSGCSGVGSPAAPGGTGTGGDTTGGAGASGTITLAGWSLASTPEFQKLADTFNATNPDYEIEVREYDATNYDTQMIADLAAGTAPDIYVQKNLKNFFTYSDGDQLMDVSDVAGELSSDVLGVSAYEVDGATYAIPYRQDGWVLFYNKDLFAQAGVAEPDGSWTWDDYAAAARELTTNLQAAGSEATGTYQHNWQSVIQGFALAQTPGADLLSGDYSYLQPYYERAVALQDDGAQPTYGTVTTNKLTYQAQFGTQKAAMLPMGSWYVATLIAQQASGDANEFEWGIAPIPQFDASTAGTGNTPVTFGDPTGLGINPAIDPAKVESAKAFLKLAASEDAATVLAGIGITPAYASDAVTEAYFAVDGAPSDDLSKFAFGTREIHPENPVSPHTAAIQNVLNEIHSGIMSESTAVDAGVTQAGERVQAEVLNR
ncbi:MAG: extracellular solute-binding protein [Propionibacteriaceae bacterium]|nr:extracellular solute-binding protein [Propionibacteriaceae bacterium]